MPTGKVDGSQNQRTTEESPSGSGRQKQAFKLTLFLIFVPFFGWVALIYFLFLALLLSCLSILNELYRTSTFDLL